MGQREELDPESVWGIINYRVKAMTQYIDIYNADYEIVLSMKVSGRVRDCIYKDGFLKEYSVRVSENESKYITNGTEIYLDLD